MRGVAVASLFGAWVPVAGHAVEAAQGGIIEQVVVTGSRIARDPNLGSVAPVQSVNAEDIKLSGKPDVADVLRQIPALSTSTSAEGSVDGIFASSLTSVGESVLQLRGMGTARTLVLVDGRRHVAGVEGTQAVDIGSIPQGLIERVEILTGGASSIYGADAVTGVVNFILKDDFEGVEVDVSSGVSGENDGETSRFSVLFGENFADGRGNVTFGLDASKRKYIRYGDRSHSANNGLWRSQSNPALNFQDGDIDPTATPNFAQFYAVDNGYFPRGFAIPSADGFAADFEDAFGSAPSLTPAELALIQRGATAPISAILRRPTFSISSNRGVIAPADFAYSGLDLDGNGNEDCLDSSVGFQSLLEDVNAFGIAGGCWVVNDDGTVRPYRDGQIAGIFNQFGGDGIPDFFDRGRLTPDDQRVTLNTTFGYDLTETLRVFGEAKMSKQEVEWGDPLNTFYDLLTVAPDNPYIPAELQALAEERGGLFITRDPSDLGRNIDQNERETRRFVLGIEGEFQNGWTYELSANQGNFRRTYEDRNAVIQDRWFAAIDVTTDDAGNPICRSDVDPTPPPTTPFNIPLFVPGFLTFTPGDGQCRPANILGGPGAISQEAIDWVTTTTTQEFEIEQTVYSGFVSGTLDFFELPGGKIAFAAGAEYREEESTSKYDGLILGVVPVDTPDANAGELVRDLGLAQNSLVFDPETIVNNSSGDYDVSEVFLELSFPILADAYLARELTFDAAARLSDYSTIGSTQTWNVGLSWAPVDDLRLRGTYAEAIRAPNIFELFDPEQGITISRDLEPCDAAAIDQLLSAGDPRGANRQANCLAAGIPAGWVNPLTARFSGVSQGNADLEEETAETLSFGVVLQPRFLDGLTVSVDYWDIEIEDAIEAVSARDILNNCYDAASFPNQYCGLFERNQDTNSAQYLGLTFLRQTRINFGSIETAGVDFSAEYLFALGEHEFLAGVSGTWVDKLDYFFDPSDSSAVDPELGELGRPEWAGTARLEWQRGPYMLGWQTLYMDEQGLRSVEIEEYRVDYGPAGIEDEFYSHDLYFGFDFTDAVQIYGGINNVTDEEPFKTEQAYPVSPLGRYFFLGVSYVQ